MTEPWPERPGAPPLLSVRSVVKRFGGVAAVDGASFDVARGACVGLIGPNGAGKTTLFNCISGQLDPDEGTIVFDGVELGSLPAYRRSRLGIGRTFQRIEVFGAMTVLDHLLVALRAQRGGPRLWRDLLGRSAPRPDELEQAHRVLGLLGIEALAESPVATLGLGSCRLVELARALVTEPALLLADEPSSGLDAHESAELARVLRSVQHERAMAVVLVEHDLHLVGEVADQVVVMDVGRVLAEGSFDQVMADPAVRRAYLGVAG